MSFFIFPPPFSLVVGGFHTHTPPTPPHTHPPTHTPPLPAPQSRQGPPVAAGRFPALTDGRAGTKRPAAHTATAGPGLATATRGLMSALPRALLSAGAGLALWGEGEAAAPHSPAGLRRQTDTSDHMAIGLQSHRGSFGSTTPSGVVSFIGLFRRQSLAYASRLSLKIKQIKYMAQPACIPYQRRGAGPICQPSQSSGNEAGSRRVLKDGDRGRCLPSLAGSQTQSHAARLPVKPQVQV